MYSEQSTAEALGYAGKETNVSCFKDLELFWFYTQPTIAATSIKICISKNREDEVLYASASPPLVK